MLVKPGFGQVHEFEHYCSLHLEGGDVLPDPDGCLGYKPVSSNKEFLIFIFDVTPQNTI